MILLITENSTTKVIIANITLVQPCRVFVNETHIKVSRKLKIVLCNIIIA